MSDRDEKDEKPDFREWRTAAMLSSVGLTLALSVALGALLGWLLDRWLRTGGVLVIVFTIIGVIAGFKQLIQTVIRASREQEALDAEARARRESEAKRVKPGERTRRRRRIRRR